MFSYRNNDTYLEQKTKNGYQRPGKKFRMNKYKRYLDEFPNRLIPPVILSAREIGSFLVMVRLAHLRLRDPLQL